MPTSYKVLGQSVGTASTSTYSTLYTVPAGTETIISTIAICNTSSSNKAIRIAISTTTTPSAANWISYDSIVAAKDSTFLTVSMTMDTTYKYLIISSDSNEVSFTAFGSEIS